MTLNKQDYKAVLRTGLIFLAPLGLIYLAQVTGALQVPNREFSLKDLVPSSFTIGAITLYVANRLTDILRKLVA